jgi:ketosteroid isomerase-like protein
LSAEQVQAEVTRFWNAMTSKNVEVLDDFYAHESLVFGTTSIRPEPGRLAAIRRQREYFHPNTTLHSQLSDIEVQLIGDTAAVASYTFQFHASHAKIGLEKTPEEHVVNGRATQVFQLDPDGHIRILHEHLSVVHRL